MPAIGIDIGGTKIAVALVDDDGSIRVRQTFAVAELSDFSAAIARIAAVVADVRMTAGDPPVAGIGVGVAGLFDAQTGVLDNPHTLPVLSGHSLTTALIEATGLQVRAENDADAALLGEAMVGAARGCAHAAMITLGTGVGGAVLVEGRLLRGAGGAHPEIGHMPVDQHGPTCYCGQAGCLESLASGTAITAAGRLAGYSSAHAVFAAAAAGEAGAKAIVTTAVAACCQALLTLIHTHHPEVVVWGGGVMAEHYQRWFAADLERTAQSAVLVTAYPVAVRAATLGNEAGLVGAASLMLNSSQPAGFTLRVCRDHEELSQQAVAVIGEVLAQQPEALLCLPTGGTPTRMYELLAERHCRDGCTARARLVKLDEWGGLPAGHPGTCEAYLRRHVLEPLAVPPARYLGFATNAADPAAECARIEARLQALPPFDLCILGLGANGHLALIEPAAELTSRPHVAQLSAASLRHPMLAGADTAGVHGLTLGLADILHSRRILLLVSGAAKAEVFRQLRSGRISTALPASLLWTHPSVLCLCDAAAMGDE